MEQCSIVLEFKNISKIYKEGDDNELKVIENSSFSIAKNEIVFLIGRSGCGKSTLLQMAGLLDRQTDGDIIINSISTKDLNEKQRTNIRKNNIGFIYQAHHLMPEFTAIENVMIPLLIHGVRKKEAFNQAKDLIAELGLESKINNKTSELSGGEKQRIAIARAIITKPSIILADEPTGNLDSNNAIKIMQLLIDVIKKYNLSMLFVTHDTGLTSYADKIITIENKKIKILKN